MQQQAIMGPEKQISDLNSGFNESDIKILEKYNLPMPHELFVKAINDDDIVKTTLEKSGKINQELGGLKGSLSLNKKKSAKK